MDESSEAGHWLYGSYGADRFVFEAETAFDAVDVIEDFYKSEDDTIDILDLLMAFDPSTDTIGDFVQLSPSRWGTTLSVDIDGGADDFTAIASIDYYRHLELNDFVDSGYLLVA